MTWRKILPGGKMCRAATYAGGRAAALAARWRAFGARHGPTCPRAPFVAWRDHCGAGRAIGAPGGPGRWRAVWRHERAGGALAPARGAFVAWRAISGQWRAMACGMAANTNAPGAWPEAFGDCGRVVLRAGFH